VRFYVREHSGYTYATPGRNGAGNARLHTEYMVIDSAQCHEVAASYPPTGGYSDDRRRRAAHIRCVELNRWNQSELRS
jgi:hypothetical protein